VPEPITTDYYEVLQVSPRADRETIERVYRHLANRYHPDNQDSGDTEKFTELTTAYRTLSNPEERATYDVNYERIRETRWRIFDQQSAVSDIAADARIRTGILSLLYVARRNNNAEPGVGIIELERLLSCSNEILKFQMWYMRENGWIERLTTGHFAITAPGVDKLFALGGPPTGKRNLLRKGETEPVGQQDD
jgi:curved DNA-binding protein